MQTQAKVPKGWLLLQALPLPLPSFSFSIISLTPLCTCYAMTGWAPMEMERTCHEKRARQHLPHSPSLDTTGEVETRATQELLVSNCRRGAQDLTSHPGYVQKQAENRQEEIPLLLHYMPAGITLMSEWVSERAYKYVSPSL